MTTLFIADDEVWVRKGLINNIDWDGLGITLAGEASDGEEALAKVKDTMPDIMLLDMRMPVMDGPALLKQFAYDSPKTLIIVISGYSDFEYTKEAIVSKVFDYLLKPVDKVALNETLKKAVSDCIYNEQKQTRLIKQQLLDSVLFDKEFKYEDLNEKKHTIFYSLFSYPCNVICIFKLSNKNLLIPSSEAGHQARGMIRDTILYYLRKANFKNEILISEYKNDESIIFIGYETREFICSLKDLFAELIDLINNVFSLETSFYIGRAVNHWNAIKTSYDQAVKCSKMRRINEFGMVSEYSKNIAADNEASMISSENEGIILEYMRQGDDESARSAIKAVINAYNENLPTVYSMQKSIVFMLGAFEKLLMEYASSFETVFDKNSISFVDEIKGFSDLDEMEAFLADLVKVITEFIGSRKIQGNTLVNEIISFISDNYSQDISLNDLAKKHYINPNYLSRLFKEQLGSNFVDYLISVRMKGAKRLLRETKFECNKISKLVGYKDFKYFSQVFKKHTGMTPTAYRLSEK